MNRRKLGELFTFTVEGSGVFPYDMLRYDNCWPYSEGQDSPLLDAYYAKGLRRVVLETCAESAPTVGRWESFTWCVIGLGECQT